MNAAELETEYNNRARVPEHPAIIAGWQQAAAAFRDSHQHAEFGLRYGGSARQYLDLFWPDARRDAPLALFIHGGYWQALDPSFFSHLADAANSNGVALALAGYDLCPQATVAEIVAQMRAATLFLWRRHRRRIVASGHSAGGHLTACLLATDWTQLDAAAPADLVPAGVSLSGLFDLEPLVATSVNGALKLDRAEALSLSPLHWKPTRGVALDAWAGGAESGEYLRQSRAVVARWQGQGATMRYGEIAGTNHFTVLEPLRDPASDISQALAAFAHALR